MCLCEKKFCRLFGFFILVCLCAYVIFNPYVSVCLCNLESFSQRNMLSIRAVVVCWIFFHLSSFIMVY